MLRTAKSLFLSLSLGASALGAAGCYMQDPQPRYVAQPAYTPAPQTVAPTYQQPAYQQPGYQQPAYAQQSYDQPYVDGQVTIGDPGYLYPTTPAPEPYYEEVPAAPSYGYVWIDGYWNWDGYRWGWWRGHWEAPRANYVYVQPYYNWNSGRYTYMPGHWQDRGRLPQGVIIRDHRDGGRPETGYWSSGNTYIVPQRPTERNPIYQPGGATTIVPSNPGYGGGGTVIVPSNPGYQPRGGSTTIVPSNPGYQGGGTVITPSNPGDVRDHRGNQGGGTTYVAPGGGTTIVQPGGGGTVIQPPPPRGGGTTIVQPGGGPPTVVQPPPRGGGTTIVQPGAPPAAQPPVIYAPPGQANRDHRGGTVIVGPGASAPPAPQPQGPPQPPPGQVRDHRADVPAPPSVGAPPARRAAPPPGQQKKEEKPQENVRDHRH
jgi:hypothetical protein